MKTEFRSDFDAELRRAAIPAAYSEGILNRLEAYAWDWLADRWRKTLVRKRILFFVVTVKGHDLAPIWEAIFGHPPIPGPWADA